MKFTKVRKVKSPSRGTERSAGIDMFVPEFTSEFVEDLVKTNPQIASIRKDVFEWLITSEMEAGKTVQRILLAPHAKILIPSGIKILGSENIALNVHNKSGVASKKGLDRLAEVIDEDYLGEIHISLVNTSPYIVGIQENEKITQLLECKIHNSGLELCEISNEEFETFSSERGSGGFGSTGN